MRFVTPPKQKGKRGNGRKPQPSPKLCGCPVGRKHDKSHPTCRSCPIDCTAARRKGTVEEYVRTWHEGKVLCTTAYLYSANHWHGRPIHVYLKQKKKWRDILAGTWALWGKQGQGMRRIVVTRQVVAPEHIIADDDNLRFALKPLLDSLKLHGVIKDDAREYILEPEITQEVGDTPLVTMEVTDA